MRPLNFLLLWFIAWVLYAWGCWRICKRTAFGPGLFWLCFLTLVTPYPPVPVIGFAILAIAPWPVTQKRPPGSGGVRKII